MRAEQSIARKGLESRPIYCKKRVREQTNLWQEEDFETRPPIYCKKRIREQTNLLQEED